MYNLPNELCPECALLHLIKQHGKLKGKSIEAKPLDLVGTLGSTKSEFFG